MKKSVSEITFKELNKAVKDSAENAVVQSFAKGFPVSYIKVGEILKEYPDGRITIIGMNNVSVQ